MTPHIRIGHNVETDQVAIIGAWFYEKDGKKLWNVVLKEGKRPVRRMDVTLIGTYEYMAYGDDLVESLTKEKAFLVVDNMFLEYSEAKGWREIQFPVGLVINEVRPFLRETKMNPYKRTKKVTDYGFAKVYRDVPVTLRVRCIHNLGLEHLLEIGKEYSAVLDDEDETLYKISLPSETVTVMQERFETAGDTQ